MSKLKRIISNGNMNNDANSIADNIAGNNLSRRDFNRLGAAALAATALGGSSKLASAQQPQSELESEYLMELLLDGGTRIDAGHTSIAPLEGGSFSGPRLRGTVMPGGADWITQVSGHSSLDVRITLLTDDDAYIYMTYRGMVVPGDSGLYWRITPLFNTAAEQYDWLNHIVCVGKNKQVAGKIAYDIWQIL
ncbi:MAG: DUF3237 domain-containing protein [Pseudohongiellaceae bacterium]